MSTSLKKRPNPATLGLNEGLERESRKKSLLNIPIGQNTGEFNTGRVLSYQGNGMQAGGSRNFDGDRGSYENQCWGNSKNEFQNQKEKNGHRNYEHEERRGAYGSFGKPYSSEFPEETMGPSSSSYRGRGIGGYPGQQEPPKPSSSSSGFLLPKENQGSKGIPIEERIEKIGSGSSGGSSSSNQAKTIRARKGASAEIKEVPARKESFKPTSWEKIEELHKNLLQPEVRPLLESLSDIQNSVEERVNSLTMEERILNFHKYSLAFIPQETIFVKNIFGSHFCDKFILGHGETIEPKPIKESSSDRQLQPKMNIVNQRGNEKREPRVLLEFRELECLLENPLSRMVEIPKETEKASAEMVKEKKTEGKMKGTTQSSEGNSTEGDGLNERSLGDLSGVSPFNKGDDETNEHKDYNENGSVNTRDLEGDTCDLKGDQEEEEETKAEKTSSSS